MDILNKSTLTVVVATAIASGMIFLTGNIIADNKIQSEPNETTVSGNAENDELNKIELSGTETLNVSQPPAGPFSNQQVLSAPIAPKKPINNSVQPTQLVKPISVKNMPQPPSKAEEVKAKLNKPSLVSEPIQPQNTNKNIPVAPDNILQQPNMGKQPMVNPANQPIWMQRGNIVPKGIDLPKSMNQKKGNTSNGQNQNYINMPNMDWNNYQPQQYMYVPVPMMQFNGLPLQMPMFNKNINPPQNSWMQNPLNNMPATQEKTAPVQKETK